MEESFEYTYSAPEQEEIRQIRSKYLPREQAETKIEKLRRLDREAERPGTMVALVLGVVGTLIFGTGMCCCLVWQLFALGVVVGILGAIMLGMAYPAYARITRRQREKIAPEILALTEELR